MQRLQVTPNYRFVCPQLAGSTNIAEVYHKHNGYYEELRSESPKPEPQAVPKAMKFQKVRWSGREPMKSAKRQFGT